MLRRLLAIALVLAVAVLGASSALRLAANGIGCAPWPSCYGKNETAEAANGSALSKSLRAVHRVAATGFALIAVALVAVGWKSWGGRARAAAVALLAVTAGLAVLGRYTPSLLPAVTLANVLGGFALLALLAYLFAAGGPARETGVPRLAVALMAALALQVGGGALISARLAGNACAADCTTVWIPGAIALADPFVAGSAIEVLRAQHGGQPLVALHRLGGMALASAAILAAVAMRGRWAGAAVVAAAATAALGFATTSFEPALAGAVAHALAAALLVASLCAVLASHSRRGATP